MIVFFIAIILPTDYEKKRICIMKSKEEKRQGDDLSQQISASKAHLRAWSPPRLYDIKMSATESGGAYATTENAVSFSHINYQSPTS
jgi:hypothetical protein